MLVEGGTIIYDIDGSASATGDAKILLDLAYDEEQEGVEVRRYLSSSSSSSASSSSSSSSASSSSSVNQDTTTGHRGLTKCTRYQRMQGRC